MTQRPTRLPTTRTRPRRLLGVGACLLALGGLTLGAIMLVAPSLLVGPTQTDAERGHEALTRSVGYLVNAQRDDGSWRSAHYAAFDDGLALTPLCLKALTFARYELHINTPGLDEACARAWGFLETELDGRDPGELDLDYPVYTASLIVLALSRAPDSPLLDERDAWVGLIRAHQHNGSNGFSSDDPAFGGWGPGRTPPSVGGARPAEADLSTTLFAIGALRLAGVGPDDPAIADALAFVERCRTEEGGFFFSPTTPVQNKAGWFDASDGRRFNAYGSPTADGARCLLRCAVPPEDPRVEEAARWLLTHWSASANPGPFPPSRETDRAGTHFYFLWSSAHALRLLGRDSFPGPGCDAGVDWRIEIIDELRGLQRSDGSWANPVSSSMEDDPLVATPLAMGAMGVAVLRVEAWQAGQAADETTGAGR